MNITATKTALPNGKTRYEVRADGEPVISMESKVADYAVVHIQRWQGRDDFAPRFSRKPKAVGSRIDYGYCAANVPITSPHPLDALDADERAALDARIDLALNGEQGWAPAIAFADNLTTTLVAQGRMTAEQAAAILDYTRSF